MSEGKIYLHAKQWKMVCEILLNFTLPEVERNFIIFIIENKSLKLTQIILS